MKHDNGVRPAERRLARGLRGVATSGNATLTHGRPPRSLVCGLAALLLWTAGALAADKPSYTVVPTKAERAALMAADEAAWATATPITWGPDAYSTRFRAAWSDDGLSLRFDATDPSPWHTMTRRDEHIWDEEVVEIFIDPDRSGHDYYELEVNPVNVVCDLRMIAAWPDKKGDIDWNLEGLETAVHPLAGAGNAKGWTVTAFLPWKGLRVLPSATHVALPPKPGDAWRFNVFRIKRPGGPKAPEKDAVFAAWSPPSGPSFHDPGAFRDLVFGGPDHSRGRPRSE
jgi:cellulose/xylan binding protein with CBM9 domain